MECIVTGLTKMNRGKVCMSLYDINERKYIRPLKIDGENYTEQELAPIQLFSIVKIEKSSSTRTNNKPHIEDILVNQIQYYTPSKLLSNDQIKVFLSNIASQSADEVFGYKKDGEPNLILDNRNWGLRPDTGLGSLGTVKVEWLKVYEDDWGKVRVGFKDKSGKSYSHIPLVMKASEADLEDLIGEYTDKDYESLYVRLSLARPYNMEHWEDTLCALQVSNINIFSKVLEY